MAKTQICLQLRATQIEIMIFQTQVFAGKCFWASIELKWGCAGIVEEIQLARMHFYLPGCNLWIASIRVTRNYFSADPDYVFATQLFRFSMGLGSIFRIEYYLCDSRAIP